MRRASPFVRWLLTLAAAVQVLLPASAAFADGLLQREAREGGVAAHVEQYGSTRCPRLHPDDCALCSVVGALASPARALAIPARLARLGAPTPDGDARSACVVAHARPASRAPPHLEGAATARV